MQITFNGPCLSKYFYRVGVQENNNTNSLTFVVAKTQEDINLENYKIYLKMQTQDCSFVNKEPLRDFVIVDNKIIIDYIITRKVSQYKNLDLQLQFEEITLDDINIWQTHIFNITFDDTLLADEYIAEENPAILQDHEKRISELEESDSVIEYPTYYDFPNIGKKNIIYIDTSINKTYRFDIVQNKYYVIGSDYKEIDIVNGNGK